MHAHKGTYREDALRIEEGSNFFIACVCDGAGSYKYSRVGAEAVCREVSARLKSKIEAGENALIANPEPQSVANKLAEMMNLSVLRYANFSTTWLRRLVAKPKIFDAPCCWYLCTA